MALENIGKQPIPGDNPSGTDVRFEPEFEELENEFGKLNSLTDSRTVDWDKVVTVSEKILAEKSKDLLVACYITIALLKRDGIGGLAAGMAVLRDMLDTFWDTLYPPKKRIRGRINAIEWLSEKIEETVPGIQNVTWPKEKRDAFASTLEGIDVFISENIDDGPVLRTMIKNILDLVDEEQQAAEPVPEETAPEETTVPGEIPEKEEKSAHAAPPLSPSPEQAAAPSSTNGDETAESVLKQGLDTLVKASLLYMKKDQISAAPFKLNRFVGWFPVVNTPPAADGKTMLPPPDAQIKSTLENLHTSENWRDLLFGAESRVRQFLFWFDLHRYVAEALENLDHPEISRIVASEAAGFVKRLPGIDKLAFSDGTPFADIETREWLKSFASDTPDSGAVMSMEADETGKLIASETEEARKLMKANKLGEALSRFRGHLNHAASQKERFLWEMGFCRLLLKVKQPRLCQPYIKQILEMLDTFGVETWDPALALEGLTVVLSALKQQDEKIRDNERIETVINRISALDPSKALDYL